MMESTEVCGVVVKIQVWISELLIKVTGGRLKLGQRASVTIQRRENVYATVKGA